MTMLGKTHIVSPHGESSLDLFVAVFDFGLPNGLNCLVFGAIKVIGTLVLVSPSIEHHAEKLLAAEIIT